MPSPDKNTIFIRVRRDVHARLTVAQAIAGPGKEQVEVASDLLTEAMDARQTPHPERTDVAAAAGQLVKSTLRSKRQTAHA